MLRGRRHWPRRGHCAIERANAAIAVCLTQSSRGAAQRRLQMLQFAATGDPLRQASGSSGRGCVRCVGSRRGVSVAVSVRGMSPDPGNSVLSTASGFAGHQGNPMPVGIIRIFGFTRTLRVWGTWSVDCKLYSGCYLISYTPRKSWHISAQGAVPCCVSAALLLLPREPSPSHNSASHRVVGHPCHTSNGRCSSPSSCFCQVELPLDWLSNPADILKITDHLTGVTLCSRPSRPAPQPYTGRDAYYIIVSSASNIGVKTGWGVG